jgi:AcrR family transcriptional regulator
VNDRLYLARPDIVNDHTELVEIFSREIEVAPDLVDLSPAARRVLATAAALFYRRGAVATSVRDVTRACGLTPGAMYNHFPAKDDLLYTLVRHGHVSMQRRLDAALTGAVRPDDPQPAATAFRAFVHAYVLGHLRAPELAQVVRREYLHLPEPRYRKIVTERRLIRRRLSAILADGARDGSFDLIGGSAAATGQAVMVLDLCSRTSEWYDRRGAVDEKALAQRYVEAASRLVGVRRR